MNSFRFILASLRHFRRIHLAVALGVAVATAVLTGALLVGDSVRGSLRDLTLERLGRIDEALISGTLFREALADELAGNQAVRQHFGAVEPMMLLVGTLQTTGGETVRATQVAIIGVRESFWELGEGGPEQPFSAGDIALTETLAHELNARVGDAIMLRAPAINVIPSDSFLGKKQAEELVRSQRFRLAAILPPNGLARFGLQPSQHAPRSAFLPLEAVQKLLEQPGKANVLLAAGPSVESPPGEGASGALQAALRPRLADYGLRVEHVTTPVEYFRISSDQLVLRDQFVEAADRAFKGRQIQAVVTYLANTIRTDNSSHKIPYSTVTGVDSIPEIGPLLDGQGMPIRLSENEIALNRWAADDLNATPGEPIHMTFYEPESTYGDLAEHESPPFELKTIAELASNGQPTPAADPKFTPDMPGVTDQAAINDWEVPFELVEPRRPKDDEYWEEYRTTPKAFVSLETAKRLWGSRWGSVSLLRIPAGVSGTSAVELAAQLEPAIDPMSVGLGFQPIKRQGLAAASGTTPFDGLFLAFSFFLMTSAVMLIALLFQLGVAGRAAELGTLAALGVERKRVAMLLSREGLLVAVAGAIAGVAVGVGYAALIVLGLRTWWVEAVATPFLELHVTPRSLAIGWLAGVVIAWATIRLSIRKLVRQSAARLLAGQPEAAESFSAATTKKRQRWPLDRWALAGLIVALVGLGFALTEQQQAGVFFGSGAATLLLLLGEVRYQLRSRSTDDRRRGLSLPLLAALNTSRHPGRSTLTIGLVAAASFLILAMSAFRLETGEAGTGGFELVATSDQPILNDLNSERDRADLGFSDEDNDLLKTWRIFPLRMKSGEDASCLNLYQPSQPTVLGVPQTLIDRGGFDWAGHASLTNQSNPWTLLKADLGRDDAGRAVVPTVIDANTATYSLKVGLGDRMTISDDADRNVTLEVVGLLRNSVLQGKLLVSEAHFTQIYPSASGYKFFLIERLPGGSSGDAAPVARMLESTLASEADPGFDATSAREQLAEFLAVQNTYLSTFQSLGALGLLLGTVGLAVVQLRSILERRGELALMRANGFRRGRLLQMIFVENAVLLLGGLVVGCVAAGVALVPQWAPQAAGVPWRSLLGLLGVIGAVGLAAGWLATRSALQAPIVPALRGD
jgi:ABC-type antimicrobial peptide transport system permease subunit